MRAMKRRIFLLSVILFAIAVIPAVAGVAPEQMTDPEYVLNQGYSQQAAEDILIMKNRATSRPPESLYDRNNNVVVRTWKTFWGYVDPAHDTVDKIHHNIKMFPSYSDL